MSERRVRRTIGVFFAYVLLAAAVVLVWEQKTSSEKFDQRDLEERNHRTWNSITEIAQGTASWPFVGRRLFVDSSSLLAKAVPDGLWDGIGGLMDRLAPGLLESRGWKRETRPLLFAAHFLMCVSVVGFMYVSRRLLKEFYESPRLVHEIAGGVFGVALLGGLGPEYQGYPYDYTQAFLFNLTLLGSIRGRWWMLPCFLAASYSKETSVLLVLAHWIVSTDRKRATHWITLGALAVGYALIRLLVRIQFDQPLPPGHTFWWFTRNLSEMGTEAGIYYMWTLPVAVVAGWRIWRAWPQFPPVLRRLGVLIVILLAFALFKGWLEERRQYLELLPIAGLLVMHWLALELGLTRLMRPRLRNLAPETGVGEERGPVPRLPPTATPGEV